jgi:hypothetical protein
MDESIFKKMRAKPDCTATVFHAPEGYPRTNEITWQDAGKVDLVHLFVESREQFAERFAKAAEACKEDGLFWVSYPKSQGKKAYDINRDSLWSLLLDFGFHPVSQISLDDEWSAVRAKKNEAGTEYIPPANVKRAGGN